MLISELITKLQLLKLKHGDLSIYIGAELGYRSITYLIDSFTISDAKQPYISIISDTLSEELMGYENQ